MCSEGRFQIVVGIVEPVLQLDARIGTSGAIVKGDIHLIL